MSFITEILQQVSNPTLSNDERVLLRCQLAKQFEKTGNFPAACGALGATWLGFGKYPNLDTLDERTAGEVLLRVGVLTGWIGSSRLIKGAQETARNRMNESIAIFERLNDEKKVAEAQIEIAYCFYREGSLDEARLWYVKALRRLTDTDGDLKAVAILRSAMTETMASRLNDALRIFATSIELFDASPNPILRGSFHGEFAKVLKNLGFAEDRQDYIERAVTEYEAAILQFEQAGHTRYQGVIENNLAVLLLESGRFADAHARLDRAQAYYTQLGDGAHLAGVEETRARVALAEGDAAKAEKMARNAIRMFEKGDEHPWHAEALTTHGVALAQLDRLDEAREVFERAMKMAEQAGCLERAGLAALAFVEQLAEQLSEDELCSLLDLARNYLKDTQNQASRKRLTECAYRALSLMHSSRPNWTNFSLDETLLRHEARLVKMALEDSGGSITKAAALLGLPGHQSLSFILNRRHPQLLNARTPIKPRRRSIIPKDRYYVSQH